MTEDNFDIKSSTDPTYTISYLKYMYKKYTNHLINMEKHIEQLFSTWVINIDTRNNMINEIDNLTRRMMVLYNDLIKKQIYSMTQTFLPMTMNIISATNILSMIENDDLSHDPFIEIKLELLSIGKINGFVDIDDFFTLYINPNYHCLISDSDLEMFELYKKVLVPLKVDIILLKKRRDRPESKNKNKSKIKITKCFNTYDSLINNTCRMIITLGLISKKFIIEGYVCSDILNVYIRSSKVYSSYLYGIKHDVDEILKRTNIDSYFYSKYVKQINSNIYFVNDANSLAEKIISDYNFYTELMSKGQNMIIKYFFRGNLEEMVRIIYLLLIGDDQAVSMASTLFDSLKDKKISGVIIGDIIYKNLSYSLQTKLLLTVENLRVELARIKTLSVETISIEKKIASMVNMPDTVKAYILEKNTEMKSGENNSKIQMAINGLMQFPWKPLNVQNEYVDIRKSLTKARHHLHSVAVELNKYVYGHDKSKKNLIELVGKWIQNPESTGQVIGLVGPPGVGKTLFAKSISSALGIPLTIVGLGGMSDSADLIGHSFTYSGAQYGMIIRQMIKAGSWRSIMFFDEVDKVSKRNDINEIQNTLIHITDKNMNSHYQDRFYSSSIEFDLSGTLIIFSYNSPEKLDPILRDRIKEIEINSYLIKEKIVIAQNYILSELCTSIGFDRSKIFFGDDVIEYIIINYTIEAGVRELSRKLEQILLKINIDRIYLRGPFIPVISKLQPGLSASDLSAISNLDTESESGTNNEVLSYTTGSVSTRKVLSEEVLDRIFNMDFEAQVEIDTDLVRKYLDKPYYDKEKLMEYDLVGVINGLYATTIGIGGILPIQIYPSNSYGTNCQTGHHQLKITGNQKKVMTESVECALNVAFRMIRKKDPGSYTTSGFHVHSPDGGTPKDGPSAGCAFVTAFVSALLNKKINRFVAMTGEIDITGKILKIGKLDVKLIGAKKAGVRTVYICEENREDYESMRKKNPEIFDNTFEVVIVQHIIDIITNPNIIRDVSDDDFDMTQIESYLKEKSQSKK